MTLINDIVPSLNMFGGLETKLLSRADNVEATILHLSNPTKAPLSRIINAFSMANMNESVTNIKLTTDGNIDVYLEPKHSLSYKFTSQVTANERPSIPINIVNKAVDILSETMRNFDKMNVRQELLSESPELKKSLSMDNIRYILNSAPFEFLCHPDCSIARDQAIAGSDIDGALIITDDTLTQEQRLSIVQDLQNQRFDVTNDPQSAHSIGFSTHRDIQEGYLATERLTPHMIMYCAGLDMNLKS